MPALKQQHIEPQQDTTELHRQLKAELEQCINVHPTYRNKVDKFMVAEGIWHIDDLDYPARERFEVFLEGEVSQACYTIYLKAFDRIKRRAIDERLKLMIKGSVASPAYEGQVLFLPYYPDPEIAGQFEHATKKMALVWDFSRAAPENMKRQIYATLDYEIHHALSQENLRNHLAALQKFYDFCTEEGVEDIEQLELEQIRRFKDTLKPGYEKNKMSGIVDCCRKALFMQTEEIRWDAPVWYMERFHIQPERLDPSNPIRHISFLEVTNKENRKLLQQYFRYGIGITSLSMKNLRTEFLYVRYFLTEMNQPEGENVCVITPAQMDAYFKQLQAKAIKSGSYNKTIMAILHFFQFLLVRRCIERIPFNEEVYLKKEVYVHHNRSVAPDVANEILAKLHFFPEEIRLIYLHLWAVGLRISEVCTLKGNAYYIQGEDAWIQVYQIKLRTYKRIPIPTALYQLMQMYIQRHHVQADDYVFQNQKGGAYYYNTFRSQLLRYCAENHIQNGEYLFKSHDYRHTIATSLYDAGVPIQSIREYLGHAYEEMTLQYIDYMPKKIEKANTAYFSKHGSLAAELLKKKGDKDNGK